MNFFGEVFASVMPKAISDATKALIKNTVITTVVAGGVNWAIERIKKQVHKS